MFDPKVTSRRIMAAYRGEQADRVPICSPISWHPARDIDREKPGSWRADADFIRVARLVQDHCDSFIVWNPIPYPQIRTRFGYQRFLEAPDELVIEKPIEVVGDGRRRHTFILPTAKGDLTWAYEETEGIETSWDARKPIEKPEDVEALLSVPFALRKPASSEYEAFRRHRREMGRDAIGGGHVNSMVAMLVGVMEYEQLLEWLILEPERIKRLADAWLERTWARVDYELAQGVGPFWHFNGVERAAPPMMSPQHWEELVVPYDGEIMRRIKERDPEARIHVHCHGRVGTMLDSWMALGVDSIDPVEPPPQGDIEFVEAKRRAAGRLTLFGNIEFCLLDLGTPDEVETAVRQAIEDGGKEHLVLFPSATPHERHTPRFTANAIRYIEAGLKYGRH